MTTAKHLRMALVLVALCLHGSPVHAKYGGGTGDPNDPYLIYTAEQMNTIGTEPSDWDKCFRLMADIDLGRYRGTEFNLIGYSRRWPDHRPFMGVFDGNGHTIRNFNYRSSGTDYVGLFGCVGSFTGSAQPAAVIRDLGLIDPNVDAGEGKYVGALVGHFRDAAIMGCYVEGGTVSGGRYVGGLIGASVETLILSYSPWLVIENCHASATVSGADTVGGLLGYYSGGRSSIHLRRFEIVGCRATGRVSGRENVGGLAGHVRGARVLNCYAQGNVAGERYIGGLIGLSYATVCICYSTGRVAGRSNIGGLIGSATVKTMPELNSDGQTIASFWDVRTSGRRTSAGGAGMSTAGMQTASTFLDAGWDFVGETDNGTEDLWWMREGQDYPRLHWEQTDTP